jgi:DNA replication protein DnaC
MKEFRKDIKEWANVRKVIIQSVFTPRIVQVIENLPDVPHNRENFSSFIYGPGGVGKTIHGARLMIAYMKNNYLHPKINKDGLIENKTIFYSSCAELFSKLKSTYDPNSGVSEYDIIKDYLESDLLFLDDLGTDKISDWAYQTLYRIINYRYEYLKETIITSNFSLEELESKLNDVRIPRRISEMCDIIEKEPWDKSK